MQTRFTYLLKYIIAFSDLLLVSIVFLMSVYLAEEHFQLDISNLYRYYLPIVNSIWLISSFFFRMYGQIGLGKLEDLFRNTWRTGITHLFLFGLTLLFVEFNGVSFHLFLIFYPLLAIGLILSRFIGTFIQTIINRNFKIRKTVAIIGNNPGGEKLASYFNSHESSYAFSGFLSESNSLFVNRKGELSDNVYRQFQKAIANGIDEVYVSILPEDMPFAHSLIEEAERQCIRLKLVPDLSAEQEIPLEMSFMGEMPILSIRHQPTYQASNRFKKRFFDLAFSSLVLVFILSWLYPLIAILIKLESPGPVLFKQQRSGKDNKSFWCYKFRSMHVNQDSDLKQASKNDSRITRLGKFMRKTSLDELPQFINVFQGYMSVVGPRPHMLRHTEEYRLIIEKYMVRQFLKPGITGWAQVNGYRGETKDSHLMERRVAHDIWYMENWTTMLDVKIIFLTVINVLTGEENAA